MGLWTMRAVNWRNTVCVCVMRQLQAAERLSIHGRIRNRENCNDKAHTLAVQPSFTGPTVATKEWVQCGREEEAERDRA